VTPTWHAARRACVQAGAVADAGGRPLELVRDAAADAPAFHDAQSLEGERVSARDVGGDDGLRVAAFLDGRQVSRVAAHAGWVPLVWGDVSAVIRARSDRRLRTWPNGLRRHGSMYVPRPAVPRAMWDDLAASGFALQDIAEHAADTERHPMAWADRAYHAVQQDREALERELAEAWVGAPDGGPDGVPNGVLYVDGGLPKSDHVARSANVLGVVKSHRTLYLDSAGLAVLGGLGLGQRTTAVRITTQRRLPVASWYVRRHVAAGRDPLFGVVRVEVAYEEHEPTASLTARADAATRLVLAERAPLALPDPRWPVMAYGIRDCEQVLKATAG
jgi:hypothetical protein